MKLRCHISENTSPFQNLAVEEWLLQTLRPGEVILYLWQNSDTIVIGKNQNAWRECLVEEFEASGGRIARRLSGGGAVYHDMGNQNFTFLAKNNLYDVQKQTEVIRRAAASFGINAERTGRNDIVAEGRKFSGNAFYQSGENRYHHGTILINSDMIRLGRFLRPSKEKLEAKGVASVHARVVNLAELNPAITPEEMQLALIGAAVQVYGTTGSFIESGRLPRQAITDLWAKYASDEWRLRRQVPFTHRLYKRFAFGEVELLLTIKQDVVQKATVHTDALDPLWAAPLGEVLTGWKATPEGLAEAMHYCEEIPETEKDTLANWLRNEFVL